MEEELYNLTVKGNDLKPYVRRFQELTTLCPNIVPKEAINIAQRLMDQVTKHTPMQVSSDNKRKFDDRRTFNNNSCSNNNYRNTNNRYNNRQQQNQRQEAGRAYAVTSSENNRYARDLPLCKRCNFYHTGPCTGKCNICNKGIIQISAARPTSMPKEEPTCMFLLNQHLVKVLFDSRADRSFISISLASKLNLPSITIDTFYDIALGRKLKKLYAKFSKCDFWICIVQFLGHLIDSQGLHVDTAKIEVVKNWTSPTTPTEKKKNKSYIWGEEQESAFQLLKQKLCETPILALPEGNDDFVVYCDASLQDSGTYLQNALGVFKLDISTAYHPETDEQSERTIQTLKDMLRACVIDFGKGWDKHLPLVEFSYNNSYHANIKAAPFEALYRRKL
ncbi:putative reverse transcriptase domain-containing protein [Tanacetum coccineum]